MSNIHHSDFTLAPHFVNGNALMGPYPTQNQTVYFGLGCFWGAERLFWRQEGVWVTAVGYQGGQASNPTYQAVCTGNTGHAEMVMVNFDPQIVSLEKLLTLFWEEHDPTQGMRQGNDVGTQYRSAIYFTSDAQKAIIEQSYSSFGDALKERGFGPITTEIKQASPFYFAEDYHQQYLAKNPDGYCGLRGTGVRCVIGGA